MDLSKLLSLVSTRAAAGIAVAALAAGTGSAVVLTTRPASSHSNQTVLSVESTNSTNSSESSNSSEDTTESSDTSNSSSTTNHGDVVTAAVSSCKSSAAAANTHGIGDCVSDVASSNGQSHRHSSSSSSSSSSH